MDLPSNFSIERRIYLLRGKKVMLDYHLAELYGVETGALNRAVKRNRFRFPADFMFQLTLDEARRSRCQIGILNRGQNVKYLPHAFTEQGVSMLSSILKSRRAVEVNIWIMRTFLKLRELLADHADLARKLEKLERKYDARFKVVFDELRAMREFQPPEETRPAIGFKPMEE